MKFFFEKKREMLCFAKGEIKDFAFGEMESLRLSVKGNPPTATAILPT